MLGRWYLGDSHIGPTGTDWNVADDVTHCLSLFVVLSVTEDALRLSVFYCQEVAWRLKETGQVVFI